MSEKPISPLRRRMLDDMTMRRFTPDTQRDYIRTVRKLAAFLGRSPDTATAEDLRAFQLHLTATGVQAPTINTIVTVLRFFFKVTLDHPDIAGISCSSMSRASCRACSHRRGCCAFWRRPQIPSIRRRSAWPMGPACGPWRLSP